MVEPCSEMADRDGIIVLAIFFGLKVKVEEEVVCRLHGVMLGRAKYITLANSISNLRIEVANRPIPRESVLMGRPDPAYPTPISTR